jgi:hypothetical protein
MSTCVASTYKSAHEYLAGSLLGRGSRGGSRLGLLGGPGRLADAAYGASRSRACDIRAASTASAWLTLATSLQDVVKAGVELGRHGDSLCGWEGD